MKTTIWTWDPLVIACLTISGLLYVRGLFRAWQTSPSRRGIRTWEAASFAAGWIILFFALVSPIHKWGEQLFSIHMTQHELLMIVAAPLLVLGRPLIPFLWALPIESRLKLGRATRPFWIHTLWKTLTNPLVAWVLHAAILWIWHIPVLFEAALASNFIHILQHTCFLVSALLFWWALMHNRGMIGYGAAVLYVFTTTLHSGLLGALLTFATSVWYPAYNQTAAGWGLRALEDQQLAGLIMWIPAGVMYLIAGLALFAGWMREAERRATQFERDWLRKFETGSRRL